MEPSNWEERMLLAELPVWMLEAVSQESDESFGCGCMARCLPLFLVEMLGRTEPRSSSDHFGLSSGIS
jgi:hypothetical protein